MKPISAESKIVMLTIFVIVLIIDIAFFFEIKKTKHTPEEIIKIECLETESPDMNTLQAMDIVRRINQYRQEKGLAIVISDSRLRSAAQARANEMGYEGWFSHNRPDGKEPWHYALANGYIYKWMGEDLAEGFENNGDIMDAWIKSPTHKKIIETPQAEDIGVGMVTGKLGSRITDIVVIQMGTK